MKYSDFETTTHGKWILAGEHAVLRGHPALVFPIIDKNLTLRFKTNTNELGLDVIDDTPIKLHRLFWDVVKHGFRLLTQPFDRLTGYFYLKNNIPIGVGMGASAALCVAVSRWFAAQEMIDATEIESFAQDLEHLFHGKSSGLDITGVAATTGVYFHKKYTSTIKQTWTPKWYLSNCGQLGITAECIKIVHGLWEADAVHAAKIDQQMLESVIQAISALENNTPESQTNLAQAINRAACCFEEWGLTHSSLKQHMQTLRDAGAIAVKPTGSGGGGYVLSLWDKEPSNISIELISIR